MADVESVATLFDSTTLKMQQLQHAFAELENQSAISLNLKWTELEEHFHGLEKSLKKKLVELKDQEKEYIVKVSEDKEMLEKCEAVVVAKELASLEHLQERRDAALSEIFGKRKTSSAEPCSYGLTSGISNSIQEKTNEVAADKSGLEMRTDEIKNLDDKPQTELAKLCAEMDAQGLHKFISDNRKNLSSIREEMPAALRSAANPFNLVLDSLKDFYSGEILGSDGKKDGNLLGLRRTCLMLMESLEQLCMDIMPGSLSAEQILSPEIKEKAKTIAKEWEPKLNNLDVDASGGNSLEAHAFLQLLASFGIVFEFDQDEICKLMPAVTRRRQAVDLCRSLGLSDKMPGLIEVLLNNRRQIEAVHLAYAFGLTEQYEPVSLLKAYLKDARKTPQAKAGSMSPGAQNEVNERELSALKSVIKCIEEHKLQEQYPVDPLQKRVHQLEKAKADKRRAAEAAKPQSKRPRANGTTYALRATGIPEKSIHRAVPERYPYSYDRQYMYPAEVNHPMPMASTPYTISPPHNPYFGNGYHQVQYQTTYLHYWRSALLESFLTGRF